MMKLLRAVSATFSVLLMLVSCVGFIESESYRPHYDKSHRSETLPAGDYLDSCTNCSVSFGELKCWCKDRTGFDKTSSISLRSCNERISNDDGRLICGYPRRTPIERPLPLGTYKDSCVNCGMHGSILRCSCKDQEGFLKAASLDTEYCKRGVGNDDGRLVCGPVAPNPRPKSVPLPFGSYKDSCQNCSMNGKVLNCACKDATGLLTSTSLDTRYCNLGISNDDGRLVCGHVGPKPHSSSLPSGGYKQSCRSCDYSGQKLSCECQDGNGVYRSTSIWTSGCHKVIENCDGRLNCGGC